VKLRSTYKKKVLLLVSEQLYFNDVEAKEVKTTTQEEILSFLFCGGKK